MKVSPPNIAKKILERLLYDDVWKTTLGDFEEYYSMLHEEKGKLAADRWYWSQVVRYAPSKIIHKLYWGSEMFFNYIKISFRNLKNQKSYSFINIFGLTVGLTCFILIGLFVQYELSYDSFHEQGDRTYRIIAEQPKNEYLGTTWYAYTPTPMAATLKQDYSEIDKAAYFTTISGVVRYDGEVFDAYGAAADGDFFDIFTYTWFGGDKNTALDDPESIVLTQSLANRLFPNSNPIGQSIEFAYFNGKETFKTVTGVVQDPPKNSHFTFEIITNDQTTPYFNYNLNEWGNSGVYTFINLKEGFSKEEFEAKLPGFAQQYTASSQYYANDLEALPKYALQPLQKIHLTSSNLNFNPSSVGSTNTVYMFSIVGLIILLIACINYMNLSTARSLTRAKEVGVRKVIGAYRSNLMMQFLSEAVVISFIGIVGALIFVSTLLPFFSSIVDRALTNQFFYEWEFWLLIAFAGFLVGIISGSYPAFYMSRLKPIQTLKSKIKSGKANTFFRNFLVVGQFIVTTVLLIGSIVVFLQLQFMRNTDTGLNRDQIITVRNSDPEFWDRFETIKGELLNTPGITQISSAQMNPIYNSSSTNGAVWEGKEESDELSIYVNPVGFDFIGMFDLNLIAGRSFSEDQYNALNLDVLLNESALNELGWTSEEALGKSFEIWGNQGTVVGVIKDYHFQSLDQPIAPLSVILAPEFNHSYLLLKIDGQAIQETIASIETVVKEFSPNYPFYYYFLDDSYQNMYNSELRLGSLFNFFSIVALIIACMGLFGLATFIIEQRTKEIGIRKVLGANALQILNLLNRDYLRLVGIGFLIALPIGWYLTEYWLTNFAYRIEPNILTYLGVALVLFSVSILTVSYKSFRTAIGNPINSLKSE